MGLTTKNTLIDEINSFQVDTDASLMEDYLCGWNMREDHARTRHDPIGNCHFHETGAVNMTTAAFGNDYATQLHTGHTIIVPDGARFDGFGHVDFAITMWVYLDVTDNGAEQVLISRFDSNNGNGLFKLTYQDAASLDRFRFGVQGASTFTAVVANNFGGVSSGTWYFLYAYHDATNDVIGISVNNGTVDTAAHSDGQTDRGYNLRLGSVHNSLSEFLGRVGPTYMWLGSNALRSAQQLTDLYQM